MPMVEVAAPICRLEEAFWLEDYGIDALPGHALQKFRDRIAQRFGVTRPGKRRIYIQRLGSRRVQNADEVENFACANGFTIYRLEEVSEEAQITLFQEAEFVLAPHGAGLSNLLFCAAGTKVIELSPDVEFRPWFWIIAEKLGLSYSVLPCRMVGDHFDGAMCVDTRELAALYQLADAAV
jgi:capsular polysaccharide biosynthesis protein